MDDRMHEAEIRFHAAELNYAIANAKAAGISVRLALNMNASDKDDAVLVKAVERESPLESA